MSEAVTNYGRYSFMEASLVYFFPYSISCLFSLGFNCLDFILIFLLSILASLRYTYLCSIWSQINDLKIDYIKGGGGTLAPE